MKFEGDWNLPVDGFTVEVEPLNRKSVSKTEEKSLGAYFLNMLKLCRQPERLFRNFTERVELEKRARQLKSGRARILLKNGEPRGAFSEEIRHLASKKYGERSWKQRLAQDAHLSAETIRKIDTLETFFPVRESVYVILLALGIESVEKAELLFQLSGFNRCTDPKARVENIVFDYIEKGKSVDDCFEQLKREKCPIYLTRILQRDETRESEFGKHKKPNHRL